jgi:hypothetical protein
MKDNVRDMMRKLPPQLLTPPLTRTWVHCVLEGKVELEQEEVSFLIESAAMGPEMLAEAVNGIVATRFQRGAMPDFPKLRLV